MRKKWTSLCLVLVMLCGMTGCIKKEEKKGSRIAYIGGCQHDRCIDRDFGSV